LERLDYFCISAEAEENLEEDVLEDKVIVVIGCSQANILQDQLVDHQIIARKSSS